MTPSPGSWGVVLDYFLAVTGSAGIGVLAVLVWKTIPRVLPYLFTTKQARLEFSERFTGMLLESEEALRVTLGQAQKECEGKITALEAKHNTDMERIRTILNRVQDQHEECTRGRLADRQTLAGMQLQIRDLLRGRDH